MMMDARRDYEKEFVESYGEELYGEEMYLDNEDNDAEDIESLYDEEEEEETAIGEVDGTKILPNGKLRYSGIYYGDHKANSELVHNDLVYTINLIRKSGIKTFEDLQNTSIYGDWSEKNLWEAYGRAIFNGIRFMVESTKLKNLVKLQHDRSSGVVDAGEVASYAVEKALFRPSIVEIVLNSELCAEETARVLMSFTGNLVADCAKAHHVINPDISELERDLETGKVRDSYIAYPTSLDTPIGDSDNSRSRGDTIVDESAVDGIKAVEFDSSVKAYARYLAENKLASKIVIALFCLRANYFIKEGVHLSAQELADMLGGVSAPTVYANQKKLEMLKDDFSRYLIGE